MKLSEIVQAIDAEVLCCEDRVREIDIQTAYASDLMSDVLAFCAPGSMLLTGLTNIQIVRTAQMLDLPVIVFVRGKTPLEDTIRLAENTGFPCSSPPGACTKPAGSSTGRAFPPVLRPQEGIGSVDAPVCLEYQVEGDDFLAAGEASNNIKETLKMLGVPSHICRRAAVVTYEVEMNLVIHAGGGLLKASIYPEHLEILAVDQGSRDPRREQGHPGRMVHRAGPYPGDGVRRGHGSSQHQGETPTSSGSIRRWDGEPPSDPSSSSPRSRRRPRVRMR